MCKLRWSAEKDMQIFSVPELVQNVNVAQVRLGCHSNQVVTKSDGLSR